MSLRPLILGLAFSVPLWVLIFYVGHLLFA